MSRPTKLSADPSLDPFREPITLLTRAELEQLIALLYRCRRVRMATATPAPQRQRGCRVQRRNQWCRAGIRGAVSERYPDTVFG
jgi:hypothetical protein